MPYAHVTALHRLVLIALFAALLAVGGWISIPIGPVPITLQTMFLTLAGLTLGPRDGALAAVPALVRPGPAHSGMFPCFLGGWVSRLLRSIRSDDTICARVSCGKITRSM